MDELTDNSCEHCGFDASAWDESSKIEAIMQARRRVEAALADTDPATLNARPSPTTWSALEYIEHIREVFVHNRLVCKEALSSDAQHYDGPFPSPLDEQPADLDFAAVLTALGKETQRNAKLFTSLGGDDWERYGILLDSKWTMRFALTHMLHELLHHLEDATESARTVDASTAQESRLHQRDQEKMT